MSIKSNFAWPDERKKTEFEDEFEEENWRQEYFKLTEEEQNKFCQCQALQIKKLRRRITHLETRIQLKKCKSMEKDKKDMPMLKLESNELKKKKEWSYKEEKNLKGISVSNKHSPDETESKNEEFDIHAGTEEIRDFLFTFLNKKFIQK